MTEKNLVKELNNLSIEELNDDELAWYRYRLGETLRSNETDEERNFFARIIKEQVKRGTANLPKPPYLSSS